MFTISIPKREMSGDCRVNGEACEYRVLRGMKFFEYRLVGTTEWDRRRVLYCDALSDDHLMKIVADDGPDSEGPYLVLQALVNENGETAIGEMEFVREGDTYRMTASIGGKVLVRRRV